MNLYHGKDGKYYTRGDIQRAKEYLVYWVTLPRGIRKKDRFGTMYSSMRSFKTIKAARKFQKKYNAPIIEKLIMTPFGMFCIGQWIFVPAKTYDEMWENDQRDYPELDLTGVKGCGR